MTDIKYDNIERKTFGGVGAADDLRMTKVCSGPFVTSNPVVIAHNNERSVKLVMEHLDILLCSEGGKVPGERDDLNAVYAKGGQQGLFLFQGVEDPEVAGVLLEDGAGMGPECDDNGLLSPFTGRGDHCLNHMPVPQMDTVKESCGYYSHLTHSKS